MLIRKQFKVTGLSQGGYANTDLKVGQDVYIKQDPTNRYDSNATGIFYRSQQIGWIPKSDNTLIAKVLRDHTHSGADNSSAFHSATIIRNTRADPAWKSDVQVLVALNVSSSYVGFNDLLLDGWVEEGTIVPDEWIGLGLKYTSEIGIADHSVDAMRYADKISKTIKKEESIMTQIVDTNKSMAKQAAYQEAGRVMLNQITKLVVKQSPMMVRGYVDTVWGKLALANAVVMAVQQFRPNDKRLAQLANAALAQAYQEVYKSFDIDGFIDQFIGSETIKTLLANNDDE